MKRKNILFSIFAYIMLITGLGGLTFAQTSGSPNISGYFVGLNGQQTGPYDASGLRRLIDQGQLTRNTLVWKTGMVNWAAAGTIEELAPLLAAIPPPLPSPQQPPPLPEGQRETSKSSESQSGYAWYNSYAQGLQDSKAFINAGIGLGPTRSYKMGIPPITAIADFKVSNTVPITIGAFITVTTWKYSVSYSIYAIDLTYLNIGFGGRGMYHFNFYRNLDVYAGLSLGYVFQSANVIYSGINYDNVPTFKGEPFFLFGVNSGIRYFFTDRIGIFSELGYSDLQYLNVGLTIKI
jgi:hypothetical protein